MKSSTKDIACKLRCAGFRRASRYGQALLFAVLLRAGIDRVKDQPAIILVLQETANYEGPPIMNYGVTSAVDGPTCAEKSRPFYRAHDRKLSDHYHLRPPAAGQAGVAELASAVAHDTGLVFYGIAGAGGLP